MVQALSIPNGGDKTHPMAHPGSLLFELTLMDEAETGRVAGKLARILKAGDIIALSGDLGAGKTAMARAMINALPGAHVEAHRAPQRRAPCGRGSGG